MRHKTLFLLFLFLPLLVFATDLKPWLSNEYEVELRTFFLYQNYRSIAIPNRPHFKRNENDAFLTLSAEFPFKRYSGEFEATVANTHNQKNRWDNFRITGRYLWLDELAGDQFNLTTGLTISQAIYRAVDDISSFHHGRIEGEAHLALGKKYGFPCSKDYRFRWWNVFGLGDANVGSPWIREQAACEYNYNDIHQLRGFIHALWGLGKHNLHPEIFRGYGRIKHQSVDLGIRYSMAIGCRARLSLQYARRVYAYNFPENANLVLLEFYLPFGNQTPTSY